jgi:hypothetical protein
MTMSDVCKNSIPISWRGGGRVKNTVLGLRSLNSPPARTASHPAPARHLILSRIPEPQLSSSYLQARPRLRFRHHLRCTSPAAGVM